MSSDIPLDVEAAPPAAEGASGESLGQQRTDLAYQRSAEAAERTLMAGVRTSLSLISFGFTIAKFFQYLGKLTHGSAASEELGHAPHHLGLVLLVGGTLTIILALIEYVSYVRRLGRAAGKPGTRMGASTALFSAVFILGVGVVLTTILVADLMSL